MGGTRTGSKASQDEKAVNTGDTLTGGIEVDLSPEDIWTLGQLLEAGAVSFPPKVTQEITTGYRILQGAGFEPEDGGRTQVELRGSGETAAIELPEDGFPDEDSGIISRQVILTEVTARTSEDAGETAVSEAERDDQLLQHQVNEAEAEGPSLSPLAAPHPGAEAIEGPQSERLAEALDRLAETLSRDPHQNTQAQGQPQAAGDLGRADDTVVNAAASSSGLRADAFSLDWAMISLGLTTSTFFVIAAAFLHDPVFGILGLALLTFSAFHAVPYLAEALEEEDA